MPRSISRLTVYLASAAGVGKTRRLLDDAIALQHDGVRVALGWIQTKGRRDLEQLAAQVPHIGGRATHSDTDRSDDFNLAEALAADPQVVVLDELTGSTVPGGQRARWQVALALREAGIGVTCALDIAHLETVAASAEKLTGARAGELVPLSFLRNADDVIALDASPEQLEARRLDGATIAAPALRALRDLMFRTIDDLETPNLVPQRASRAVALATGDGDSALFLRKSASLAGALDLALDIALVGERDIDAIAHLSDDLDAHVVPLERFDAEKPQLSDLKATLVSVPRGDLAYRIATRPTERDAFIVDAVSHPASGSDIAFPRYAQTVGDRMRIGYGRLTIYLGAGTGSGKTYAMLDRAHQLQEAGIEVLGAFIETHERTETAQKANGLTLLPRREFARDGVRYNELDLPAVLARRPAVALIDDLAHTNPDGELHGKRYDDVLHMIRAGISVITTLDVGNLEGLGDAVHRLTGERVRETVPDDILELADDVILVDASPETLRERLRARKIHPTAQVDDALTHAFRSENLAALRELALREVVRARRPKAASPFSRLVLGVKARERDAGLIERCARIALRLSIDLWVVHATKAGEAAPSPAVEALAATARRVRARWSITSGPDAAGALVAAMGVPDAAILAIEGARRRPIWPRGLPFARRVLDAGAKQLLILGAPL